MKKILSFLDNIENYVLLLTFPLMLSIVFIDVLFRYIFKASLPWAGEAARYLMIWLAFAGISLGFKKNTHVGLSFFEERLAEKGKKIFIYIRSALVILFGGLIAYYVIIIMQMQIRTGQVSAAMEIPVWWVYAAVLFGSIMIIVRTLQMAFFAKGKDRV